MLGSIWMADRSTDQSFPLLTKLHTTICVMILSRLPSQKRIRMARSYLFNHKVRMVELLKTSIKVKKRATKREMRQEDRVLVPWRERSMCRRTGLTRYRLCVVAGVASAEHGGLLVAAIEAHLAMAVQQETIAETGRTTATTIEVCRLVAVQAEERIAGAEDVVL